MKMMMRTIMTLCVLGALTLPVWAAENPFLGGWDLTLPNGGAGWLGVTQEKGYLDGGILWGGGSVVPVSSVCVSDDPEALIVTRSKSVERKDEEGKVVRTQILTTTIMGRLSESGDSLKLMQFRPNANGKGMVREEFTAKRTPPLPAKPNLSKLKYGKPISLLKKSSTEGWELTSPGATSGWSVKNGILTNNPVKKKGAHYGNLRTVAEFEDFNLTLETRVQKGQNSGIYLRGIYEVQVMDSFGKGLDPHNMGAVYSRITPSVSAEKAPNEWQTFDITLCDRHVRVILNGQTIIDNEPLLGCTGGALRSDQLLPGPLYLQGDHTGVEYRNIVLKPVVK